MFPSSLSAGISIVSVKNPNILSIVALVVGSYIAKRTSMICVKNIHRSSVTTLTIFVDIDHSISIVSIVTSERS